jgi:dephospho-CoA kinase
MTSAIAQPADPPTHAPPSERIDLVVRPAERAMLIVAFPWLIVTAVVGLFCLAIAGKGAPAVLLVPVCMGLFALLAATVILMVQRFELTSARVRASRGVFSRITVDARLDHVRNITVTRSFLERILAIGTIRMTTAGVGPEVVWGFVARPIALAAHLRRSIDAADSVVRPSEPSIRSDDAPIDTPVQQPSEPTPSRPAEHAGATLPVIGLAGGIGAGKSTVAQAFARLGCLVIDSDVRAKAALDRPEVRDQLVRWWGDQVLTADRRIDRARVARIVFSDADERSRLERLVHPIVREDRARMIEEARAAGARAVIVDAPLLFEAGIDAECDAVVFVDAPREQRIQRVRQTRGWEPAELARREAAQMPIEDKRARSQYVVENHSKPSDLDGQAEDILRNVENGPDSADLPLPS